MQTHPHVSMRLSISGPDGSRELTLDSENVMIGTDATAAVRLEDDSVSSVHAMLKVHAGGQVSVVDLGSEGGTMLGGKAVVNAPVPSGSVLKVGRTSIQVEYPANGGVAAEAKKEPKKGTVPVSPAVTAAPAKKAVPPARPTRPAVEKGTIPEERTYGHGAIIPRWGGAHITPRPPPTGTLESRSESAMRFFLEELPKDRRPTNENRRLQLTQLWADTVVGVRAYAPTEVATLGPKGDFEVWTDGIGESFALARGAGDGFEITIPPGAKVAVAAGQKELNLEDASAGKTIKIGLDDRALLQIGNFTFVARQVAPPKRIATSAWEEFDFYFSKTLSLMLLVFLTMVGAFYITPVHSESLSEDLFKNANRYAKYILKPPEKQKKLLKDLSGIKEGAKAAKEEGKFGKKEAQKKEADPSKKGAPVVNANKREEDRKKVMSQLSWLSAGGAEGAASNIFGPGGLGTGINNALGGLQGGAGLGDAHGVGGLGSRGTGPGGGGTALGIGGLGTKGGGRGRGGYGELDLGGRGKGDTEFDSNKTIVQGGLDKETIARVIKRHWNEIKYCYEKELSKDPNLYGKVTVNFIIDGTGTVSEASIQQTTMNNENVEACMLSHVRRWRFPEPKGGGEVIVTYPWVFKPAG